MKDHIGAIKSGKSKVSAKEVGDIAEKSKK